MAEQREPIGPLHELPVSVKEHIGMKGLICNADFVAWADKVVTHDALILKILWEAGCVFYVRTTEPQTLVCVDPLDEVDLSCGSPCWIFRLRMLNLAT